MQDGGSTSDDINSIDNYFKEEWKKIDNLKYYINSKMEQLTEFSRNSSYIYELFSKIENYIQMLTNPNPKWTKEDVDKLIENYNESVKEINRFVGLFQDGTK